MSVCTVSDQADVDKMNSSSCFNIVIQAAAGALNFSTLNITTSIAVENSPALETLHFPQLSSLSTLTITDATALNTVSLPMFSTGEYVGVGPSFNLNISNAPKLSTFELQNLTGFGDLALFGSAPNLGTNVSVAISVKTDSAVLFEGLQDVGELQIVAVPGWSYELFKFRSAGNITVSNANRLFALVFESNENFGLPPIKINESLVLESAVPPDPVFNEGQILFSRITTVGANLSISSMSSFYLDFEGLTNVGGDLSLRGNTNCSWNFDQVTTAGSLTILDNESTVIPLFPQLRNVGNIHLRGNINTSTGPNIFPELTLARGNVTIEPWNADFNCSKLVSQWNDGLINHLSCNGTGGTVTTTKPKGSSRLAPGALAGIGVGSGVFGLLLIGAIVWLVLRHKRQIKTSERTHPQSSPTDYEGEAYGNPRIPGIHEVDGAGIIREKPDDPVIIRELPVLPHELSSSA